ncbi:MAG: hypothetical protein AVDCRST_MAG93-5916 [uncultured Chloroflexia bacterium]|uniref:Uncharacterized protein n=1 Tax=uncultured Chloroflexia bacterium TaxID=1672391 RepID=A0A6J4L817_9CHLR|nr:MAG: hypothetical protein AVDCRST_MAG93-5916 [uncultured Chloroflexia bacterium]
MPAERETGLWARVAAWFGFGRPPVLLGLRWARRGRIRLLGRGISMVG